MHLSNFAVGGGYSLLAAVSHSMVESLRKHASSRDDSVPLQALVALPCFIEALICLFVDAIRSEDGPAWAKLGDGRETSSWRFIVVVISSSCILLAARVLYQRALSLAPLSLTVPYLSFTPVLLVAIAFIALKERPSSLGLVGVLTVGLGGYLLSVPQKERAADVHDDEMERGGQVHGRVTIRKGPRSHRRNTSSSITDSPSFGSLAIGDISNLKPTTISGNNSTVPLLMICVATLFSITSSLDKLGLTLSPNHTVFVYVTLQRFVIALLTSLALAFNKPADFVFLFSHFKIIFAIAALELLSVLFFLQAIDHLHVAYVVTIKRANILISVIVGAVFFKEPIRDRLKYVLLMTAGCILIVLEPSQSTIHHELHQHNRTLINNGSSFPSKV